MKDKETEPLQSKCGYIAIIGKPNVGKSTLLNCLVRQKLSITSRKPQTTRHQLLGIRSTERVQYLYVDTPGIHKNSGKALNRYMNKAAKSIVSDVDVVLLVLDRNRLDEEDELAIDYLGASRAQLVIGINKMDRMPSKEALLPHIKYISGRLPGIDIVPVSARTGYNVEHLEALLASKLPEEPFIFPVDQLTDRSERFLVSELIREKMVRQLGKELPYELAIGIETFSEQGNIVHIDAVCWLERESQKGIVVGKGGSRLKSIATDARRDIEKLLDRKVMLRIYAKARTGWSDNERILNNLGYISDS